MSHSQVGGMRPGQNVPERTWARRVKNRLKKAWRWIAVWFIFPLGGCAQLKTFRSVAEDGCQFAVDATAHCHVLRERHGTLPDKLEDSCQRLERIALACGEVLRDAE